MSLAYEITIDRGDIVIRISRQATNRDSLIKLLDYLELEAMRSQSQLTEDSAESLTKKIKQSAWLQVKHLFKES